MLFLLNMQVYFGFPRSIPAKLPRLSPWTCAVRYPCPPSPGKSYWFHRRHPRRLLGYPIPTAPACIRYAPGTAPSHLCSRERHIHHNSMRRVYALMAQIMHPIRFPRPPQNPRIRIGGDDRSLHFPRLFHSLCIPLTSLAFLYYIYHFLLLWGRFVNTSDLARSGRGTNNRPKSTWGDKANVEDLYFEQEYYKWLRNLIYVK